MEAPLPSESPRPAKSAWAEMREAAIALLMLPLLPLAVFYPIFLAAMYLLPVLCVLGFIYLWSLPAVARRHDVEQFNVALRIVSAAQRDPLHFLGDYQDLLPPRPIVPSDHEIKRIETLMERGYANRLPPGANQGIIIGAPLTEWDQVRNLGFRFYSDWVHRAARDTNGNLPSMNVVWLVWLRLASGNPHLERDFVHLPRLFASQPPSTQEWTRTLFHRLKLKRALWDDWTKSKSSESHFLPENDTTLGWLAYQMLGLNNESRDFAERRWRSRFAPAHLEAVRMWGRELEKERRSRGEPLPPSNDAVAILCVVERFLGVDGYGERSLRAIPDLVRGRLLWANFEAPSPGPMTALGVGIRSAYPNSDLHNLVASGDPFHQFPGSNLAHQDWKVTRNFHIRFGPFHFPALATYIGLQVLLGFACYFTIFFGFVPLLDLEKHPYFATYAQSQNPVAPRKLFLSFLLVPVGSWLAALYLGQIDVPIDYLMKSPYHKLLAIYVSTIAGGILITFMNRIIALMLICMGFDLKRTLWDELVGGLLGAMLLFHFGSSPIAIARSLAFAIAPELFFRLQHWRDPPPDELPPQWRAKAWEIVALFAIVIGIALCLGVWMLQHQAS